MRGLNWTVSALAVVAIAVSLVTLLYPAPASASGILAGETCGERLVALSFAVGATETAIVRGDTDLALSELERGKRAAKLVCTWVDRSTKLDGAPDPAVECRPK